MNVRVRLLFFSFFAKGCPWVAALGILLVITAAGAVQAQEQGGDGERAPLFADFVEPDFPFLSQTLDARDLGKGWPERNLTPRGLIFSPGGGLHVCFDIDLLRVALVWREEAPGEFFSPVGMAPGSYHTVSVKASAGQGRLPKPLGEPLLATGVYPGWSVDGTLSQKDPRLASVDSEEVGRGPLPASIGRWKGIRLDEAGAVLEYEIGERAIRERFRVEGEGVALRLVRELRVAPGDREIRLVFGASEGGELLTATFDATRRTRDWRVSWAPGDDALDVEAADLEWPGPPPLRWDTPLELEMPALSKGDGGAYVTEDLPLPVPNPWKRNVRFSDFAFFEDGRVALVTFDGDVWLGEGVDVESDRIRWKRFASGLHEPLAMEVSGGQIYVFDRNGISRLHDTDGNGEADFHENFCNLMGQTAETREFAMGLVARPEGGFYLSKGGQVGNTRGHHNGTILAVSADGASLEVVATGMRQPFIGIDPKTGRLTASDQQGHWRPTTPLYPIETGGYYGFQPAKFGGKATHPNETIEPPLWVPHFVNPSAAGQVWLRDAKMGPLDDALILIGYNRPELFRVFLDEPEGEVPQAATVSISNDFRSGLLAGKVHPVDGQIHVAGFKIWGTVGRDISTFARLRYTGEPARSPVALRSGERGVLLRFDQKLDADIAGNPATYTVDRWNYKRSHNYGSGNFRLDGEPGQESLPVANAYLSKDGKAVFLAIPDMKPVHSLRVSYRPAWPMEQPTVQHAYYTIHALRPIDLAAEGFGDVEVDLTVRAAPGQPMAQVEPSIEEGKKAAALFGCVACHSTDGSKLVAAQPGQVVGPSWKGLYGAKRTFVDGSRLKKVDEVYLRESIIDPGRRVAEGFEVQKTGVGMPSYLGVLKDYQIDSIILYIKSLK